MNISKDGISISGVKSGATQLTVSIVTTSLVVSFVISFVLNMFEIGTSPVLTNVIATVIGLSVTCYLFLKKILGAMAHDATNRGATEELYNEFRK